MGTFGSFTFYFLNRLGQHLIIQIQSDLIDGAGLFAAKDVARTPDFEVAEGDVVAGAQVGVILEGLEAVCGFFSHVARLVEEVGKCLSGASAYAAAQLVRLGKADHGGIVYDKRVCG